VSGRVRACVRALQKRVGKGRTLLLGEDDFDHTPKELAAVPVLLGVLRILVVEELDEGERLLPPADAHSVSGACLPSAITASTRCIQSSAPQSRISILELRTGSSGASCHGAFLSTCLRDLSSSSCAFSRSLLLLAPIACGLYLVLLRLYLVISCPFVSILFSCLRL